MNEKYESRSELDELLPAEEYDRVWSALPPSYPQPEDFSDWSGGY